MEQPTDLVDVRFDLKLVKTSDDGKNEDSSNYFGAGVSSLTMPLPNASPTRKYVSALPNS
jgi:hypothetical protein